MCLVQEESNCSLWKRESPHCEFVHPHKFGCVVFRKSRVFLRGREKTQSVSLSTRTCDPRAFRYHV